MPGIRGLDGTSAGWDWEQVRRWCALETRRVLGSGAAAEDAAQEAALRAWRRRDQCRPGGSQRAWVSAIARNEARRAVSTHRDEVELTAQREPSDGGRLEEDTAERLDLAAALGALGPGDRRLLSLRYWADLTQAETAERLGLPEGTVKVRLHRLRTTLRAQLV